MGKKKRAPARKKAAPAGKKKRRARRAAGRRLITTEDLLQLKWLSEPQLSPAGDQIVFGHKSVGDRPGEYVRNLWMVAADGESEPQPFTSGGKDGQPRWSPNGDHVAFISGRAGGPAQIWKISASGGEAQPLTALPEGTIADYSWSPDGLRIAVSFRPRDPARTKKATEEREEEGRSTPPKVLDDIWYRLDGDGYFEADRFKLYIIDVKTGAHRELFARDVTGMFSFAWSPDSRRLAVTANTDKNAATRPWLTDVYLVDATTGRHSLVANLPFGPKENLRFSPDGRYLAYAGRKDKSGSYDTANLELWLHDLVKGSTRSLTGREDYCLLASTTTDSAEVSFAPSFAWSSDSRRIFMRIGWHGETHIASVLPRGRGITFHTKGALDHDLGNIVGDRVALLISSPLELGDIHIGRIDGAERFAPSRLTAMNAPLLKQLRLSRPRSHWVKSADGSRVQTWSIRPPNHKGNRKIPAVLEIHGGPHAQYGVGFFHEMQVLAAAGYAVFFSNPRGSKGYGQAHCEAIRGNWGSVDWEDIQAVTRFMAEQPWVDDQRLGIMGGSYGGYMTNWAIGHSRDYKAAITDRCVSNMVSMVGSSDFPEEPGSYFPGSPWDNPDELWRQSPLKYFGKVKTPTLIIHSEGDLRCNVEQAEQVFTALKLRGVPSRFIRYPANTSHGMSRGGPPDLRIHRLKAILEWWEKYLAK